MGGSSVKKVSLPSAIALSAICAIATLNGADQPRFETASVKRVERGTIRIIVGPGTVTLRGASLMVTLKEAFKVEAYQIVGPPWLDEDCFDIVARMPEGASGDDVPAMLQALLAERFKLTAHKEDRTLPVFALVVDKGGPKFKEADVNFQRMGLRRGTMGLSWMSNSTSFKGAVTMARLARFLTIRLDRPVQDFTGLSGTYDIDLAWAPDPLIDRQTRSATSYSSATAALGDAGTDLPAAPTATLFTAIRDSLGLKLEPREEPVEMLVIDRVERIPNGN